MRRSCVIQACTTPSEHVNRLGTMYVITTTILSLPCTTFSSLPFLSESVVCELNTNDPHARHLGTPRTRASMCPTHTPQRAHLLRALARPARRHACTATYSVHGPCSTRTSTPRSTTTPR